MILFSVPDDLGLMLTPIGLKVPLPLFRRGPGFLAEVQASARRIGGGPPGPPANSDAGPQGLPYQPGGANRSERSRTPWA